jgi:hypothetical protein
MTFRCGLQNMTVPPSVQYLKNCIKETNYYFKRSYGLRNSSSLAAGKTFGLLTFVSDTGTFRTDLCISTKSV